jgi:hypothetical protein
VRDLVLIHGTGTTYRGWDRLVAALEPLGVRCHAVDLPHDRPDLTAEGYAAVIRDQVGEVSGPAVLAHSASGLLLPAAARTLSASRQIWLAAWIPSPEDSLLEEVTRDPSASFNLDWLGRDPVTDDDVARRFLYHDCDEETAAWALTTRRHFVPSAVYEARIELAPEILSTAIVASADRTILPEWQRRAARERLGVEPLELASGHCPAASRPAELAALLHGSLEGPAIR